jgi:hypothetical protein
MMKLMPSRNAPAAERGPVILPLRYDAERRSAHGRPLSAGTRLDLVVLTVWLIGAGLAMICIFLFLLYSYLPTIARV